MISACLFDMDGVIVDTAKFHFKAWQRLADSLSIPFTEEQNEQLKGVSRVDSLEKILHWGNLSLDNARKEQLMELKNKWYIEYVETVDPDEMLPGIASFLNELKNANIKIGLGSSSKNAVLILEKLGIMSLFDVVVDGTKVHLSKPHPEIFLRGSRELSIPVEDIIVFEDAQSGVKAAINGGFRCVGIGDERVLNEATVVVSSTKELSLSNLNQWFN